VTFHSGDSFGRFRSRSKHASTLASVEATYRFTALDTVDSYQARDLLFFTYVWTGNKDGAIDELRHLI
jgi:hypothetical protein